MEMYRLGKMKVSKMLCWFKEDADSVITAVRAIARVAVHAVAHAVVRAFVSSSIASDAVVVPVASKVLKEILLPQKKREPLHSQVVWLAGALLTKRLGMRDK